jgi:hypothetical protein
MDQGMKATIEPALKMILIRLTEQLQRLDKNNSQLKSINDKFKEDSITSEGKLPSPNKDSPGVIYDFNKSIDDLQMFIADYNRQLTRLSEII